MAKRKVLNEISSLNNPMFELSSKAVNGRRGIRFIALEIPEDEDGMNENGITWVEEYVRNNMNSAVGMSITADLIDREMPTDHGYTGNTADGLPTFSADIVGHTDSATIEYVMVEGRKILAFICAGYIDEMRYPKFVAWLQRQLAEGSPIKGSIEIAAKTRGQPIAYDGGYKPKGRRPMHFDFTGYSIITVRPSDPAALIMELNSTKSPILGELSQRILDIKPGKQSASKNDFDSIREQISKLELNRVTKSVSSISKYKEDNNMEESKLKEILASVKADIVSELNTANDNDDKMREVCEERDDLKKQVANLKEQLEKATNEKNELNEQVKKAEKDALVAELNSHLSKFSEEDQKSAKTEIEAFMKAPTKSEINSIVGAVMIAKGKRDIENARTIVEQNSFSHSNIPSLNTIFGAIDDSESFKDVGSGSLFN